jgi:hypothetical protein
VTVAIEIADDLHPRVARAVGVNREMTESEVGRMARGVAPGKKSETQNPKVGQSAPLKCFLAHGRLSERVLESDPGTVARDHRPRHRARAATFGTARFFYGALAAPSTPFRLTTGRLNASVPDTFFVRN